MAVVKADMRLAEKLVQKRIIDQRILSQALKMMQGTNGHKSRKLHDVLINDFKIDRHKIFCEISDLYAFRKIDLALEQIDDTRLNFIRGILYNLAESIREKLIDNKVIPFKHRDEVSNIIIFITPFPTDIRVHQILDRLNIKNYEIAYTREEEVTELIDKVIQAKNDFLQLIEGTDQFIEEINTDDRNIDEDALDAEINRSMLTNLIEGALVEAVRQGASDIHIIPKDSSLTEFYFRIDGKLQLWHTLNNIRPEAVTAVVKDRTQNVDRFDRDIAQDGYIQRKIDNNVLRYRVSILPIVGIENQRRWESTVIRILDDRKVITNLQELGLHHQAMSDFVEAISKPQGMVILTGPTGSGKSTTLVAALNHVMDPSRNVLTVEEPVEYMIPGARQIKLGHKLDFNLALRSILRHDPDIVMVGEMRDSTSAKIGITLANTGHLTFSTLHTNDAPSAVARFYMLGIELFLIANAINLIMAQRLVRTLCPLCKRPVKNPNLTLINRLGFTEEEIKTTTFYEAVGCDKCYGGYKGRSAIVEALPFTKEIRNLILQSNTKIDEEAIRQQALAGGMLTLRESGRERIKNGSTTCDEVMATTMSV
jgi:type IV pilus assembly protein PilB